MNAQAVAWAIGLGLPVLAVAILFLGNWCHSLGKKIDDVAQKQATDFAHIAENYVRGHEIVEVKRAVETLRQELTGKVDELLKAVHQLIGKHGS